MREIKFRAWVRHQKVFWYPGTVVRVTLGHDLQAELGEDIILQQFTGLKDKNGKEIYEGDIVDFRGTKLSIEWNESKALFTTSTGIGDESRYSTLPFRYLQSIEIIGNIYENPELSK